MNDIAKQNIKEKLVKAIEAENLLAQDVAAIFEMHPSCLSWIKNPKYWNRAGNALWGKVLCWVNSGQTLKEYSEKKGKVLCDKSIDSVPKVKETVLEPLKSVSKPPKEAKQIQEKEHRKLSIGEMVDMLLEEKGSLQSKIDAIDVLLKFYIS